MMIIKNCNSFEHAVKHKNEVIGGPVTAAEESVIKTAGRPKCYRKQFEYKIHYLSHITYRIKTIKISFCILSTNLISIA